MAVYCILRTHYDTPSLFHVREHADESLLDFFRNNWNRLDDKALFGTQVYGFDVLGEKIQDESIAAPGTPKRLAEVLYEHAYVEGEIRCSGNAIRALTDDDELELAWYIMDDRRIVQHGNRVAFMIRKEWELPEDINPVGNQPAFAPDCDPVELGEGDPEQGAVYAAFLSFEDSGSLSHQKNSYKISGIRLPELCDYLLAIRPSEIGENSKNWPFELKLLRAQLDSSLKESLQACFGFKVGKILNTLRTKDFFGEDQREAISALQRLLGDSDQFRIASEFSKVQAATHVAQLSLHVDTWQFPQRPEKKLFHRWIFFDDVWARSNPELASSILTCGLYWDTPEGRN